MAIGPDRLNYNRDALAGRPLPMPPAEIPLAALSISDLQGPRVTELGGGDAIVDLDPKPDRPPIDVTQHDANIAETLDDHALGTLAEELLEGIDTDIQSRKEWEEDYIKGLKILGLRIEETHSQPFDGASAARWPLLLKAVLKFQAEALGELMPAEGPAKTNIVGDDTEALEEAAGRVQEAFNYYLTQTDGDYYPDLDRMLWHLAAIGTTFKKVYNCPLKGRPVSPFLLPDDVIVNQNSASLETAQRVTNRIHLRKSDVIRLQLKGFFRNIELTKPTEVTTAIKEATNRLQGVTLMTRMGKDDRHTLFECCCEYDMPGFQHSDTRGPTGLPLPWMVTVDLDSRKVLRIQRGWRKGDPEFQRREIYVKYEFLPGPGFYAMGFIQAVGNPQIAATQMLRSTIDAGMFRNFPAGITSGEVSDDTGKTIMRMGPGELKGVKTDGMPIKDAVMMNPFQEPSTVLIELMRMVVQGGEEIAGTANINIAEGRHDAPVGTTLALLEQALKITGVCQKRCHRSQSKEFRLLQELFAENPESTWKFRTPQGKRGEARGNDFALVEIVPVSDPNVPSQTQRLVRADGLGRLQAENPGQFDQRKTLLRRMKIMGYAEPEELLTPPPPTAVPMDPMSENQAVMQGMPLKADIHQDHSSHIAVHLGFIQTPLVGAMPGAMPAMTAHVAEHLSLMFRSALEAAMGQPLPPPGQQLPPQVELILSQQMAVAMEQVREQINAGQGGLGLSKEMLKAWELQIKSAEIARRREETEIENKVQMATAMLETTDRAADRASKERIARMARDKRSSPSK